MTAPDPKAKAREDFLAFAGKVGPLPTSAMAVGSDPTAPDPLAIARAVLEREMKREPDVLYLADARDAATLARAYLDQAAELEQLRGAVGEVVTRMGDACTVLSEDRSDAVTVLRNATRQLRALLDGRTP